MGAFSTLRTSRPSVSFRGRALFFRYPAEQKNRCRNQAHPRRQRMRDGVHIRLTLTRGVKITSGMDPRLNQSGPTLIILAEHKAPVYAKSGL